MRYVDLEYAIKAELERIGAQGILTEWVVVTATTRYDDEGPITQVGTILPGDEVPFHRMMGLLDYALTLARSQITGE